MSTNEFEFVEDQENQEPQQFIIDNDTKADWAVRTIQENVALRDRLTALADAQIKELQEKKMMFAERCQKNTQYLSDSLFVYFQGCKTQDTKTQSKYQLVSGTLLLKKQAPEYVRDEQVMIPWAEASAPSFIRIEKRINWGDLKKFTEVQGEAVVLKDTGEIIPGVVAKARDDVFEVTK